MGPQTVNTRNCIYEDVEGEEPCSGPDEFITNECEVCGDCVNGAIYACEIHAEDAREAYGV